MPPWARRWATRRWRRTACCELTGRGAISILLPESVANRGRRPWASNTVGADHCAGDPQQHGTRWRDHAPDHAGHRRRLRLRPEARHARQDRQVPGAGTTTPTRSPPQCSSPPTPNPLIVKLVADATGAQISISWGMWALAMLLPGLVAILLMPLVLYWLYPPQIKTTPNTPAIRPRQAGRAWPFEPGRDDYARRLCAAAGAVGRRAGDDLRPRLDRGPDDHRLHRPGRVGR